MKTLTLLALALTPAVALAAPMMTAKTYVMKAGAADTFETESSKLVTDSKNAKIASFAQMMITDHAKSTDDVVAAAKADGMTPGAPMMTAPQKAMIAGLKAKSGTARDALYAKDQVTAHKATLVFQKAYAANGSSTHLKDTAGTIVPVVEHHLSDAESLLK